MLVFAYSCGAYPTSPIKPLLILWGFYTPSQLKPVAKQGNNAYTLLTLQHIIEWQISSHLDAIQVVGWEGQNPISYPPKFGEIACMISQRVLLPKIWYNTDCYIPLYFLIWNIIKVHFEDIRKGHPERTSCRLSRLPWYQKVTLWRSCWQGLILATVGWAVKQTSVWPNNTPRWFIHWPYLTGLSCSSCKH